jgi:hypothetical protein
MNTLQHLLHCDGRTDRLTYQRNVALLAVGKTAVDLVALTFLGSVEVRLVALSWIDPFVLVRPWSDGTLSILPCASTLAFFTGLVWNSVHRARDIGWNHWLGLLSAVPFAGLLATVVLSLVPPKKRTVWDLV